MPSDDKTTTAPCAECPDGYDHERTGGCSTCERPPYTTDLDAAKDMIRELQTAMLSVQRSAFDAGYDAGKEGRVRKWAYKEWSHT